MNAHPFSLAFFIAALTLTGSCGRPTRYSPTQADLVSIRAALQMFQMNTGRFPTAEEGLQALIEKPATLPAERPWTQIMDRIPDDPWDRPYQYEVGSGSLRIFSMGNDPLDPKDDVSLEILTEKKQPD